MVLKCYTVHIGIIWYLIKMQCIVEWKLQICVAIERDRFIVDHCWSWILLSYEVTEIVNCACVHSGSSIQTFMGI
jgi:hypothetical protein